MSHSDEPLPLSAMNSSVMPAIVAILLGLVIGFLLFVPFVAVQYRRHGRLTWRQLLLWAAFLVYALALWTYTLLPLPDPNALVCVGAQTRPLQFLDDIRQYPVGSVGDLARNPAVMQVVLNVALFVPLGFFLRLVWRRGIVASALAGFVVSLAIELTQRTGVWGIYVCAYRLFDVDDLIANTSGAVLGGILSLALVPVLTRADTGRAPAGPRPVTRWRRVLGALCDVFSVWILGSVAGAAVNAYLVYVQGEPLTQASAERAETVAILVPLIVFGFFALATGRTVGDAAVLLRWDGGVRPAVLRSLLRYVGGVGGWQLLLAYVPGFESLFLLVSLITMLAMRTRAGLPGVVSRAHPVDSRA